LSSGSYGLLLSAPASSPQASPTSEQDIYTATLLKDEKSLDRGVLTYSRIRSLKTAAKTQFKVGLQILAEARS
jgi:hypothetical protein